MGFGNLSGGEVVILLLIFLLVFGANRLPDAGKAVGKGLREFKRALSDAQNSINDAPTADPHPPRDATPKRLVE